MHLALALETRGHRIRGVQKPPTKVTDISTKHELAAGPRDPRFRPLPDSSLFSDLSVSLTFGGGK